MHISKVYLYFGKFGEEMKIMSHLNNKSRFRELVFSNFIKLQERLLNNLI